QWMADLVALALDELKAQGYTEGLQVYRKLDLRYLGQNYELELPYQRERFDAEGLRDLWSRFHEQHEARFGFAIGGETIELVNMSGPAMAPSMRSELVTLEQGEGEPEPVARRSVRFDDERLDTKVFDRAHLLHGHRISGPALIEESVSVTVVRPRHTAEVDAYGNLRIAS